MKKLFDKKYIYPAIGVFLILVLAGGSLIAVHAFREGHEKNGFKNLAQSEQRGFFGVNPISGTQRAAVNTASGVDVVITTAGTGGISEMNGLFELTRGSVLSQNSAYSITSVKTNNSLKISITSSVPDVVKIIQDKAANGTSGIFGIELLGGYTFGGQPFGHDEKYRKTHNKEFGRKSR